MANMKDFHLYTDSVYLKSKAYNLRLITNDTKDIDLIINNLVRLLLVNGNFDISLYIY